MPIQHAVLALLGDGPAHGYQIRAAFEGTVGPQWGGLNLGHLYQVLDRLARDGQVSASVVPQASRPDRKVYELTSAGRDELARWLAEPAEHTGGYRDDFVLKLMAAARRDEADLREVLRRQRSYELSRLKGLDQLARDHRGSALISLLVRAAILHTRADLDLVDEAEQHVAALTSAVADDRADRPVSSSGRPDPQAFGITAGGG